MAKRSAPSPAPTATPAAPGEAAANPDPPQDMAAVMVRARRLMLISALTTAVAIAAVVGVIGYRLYSRGESTAGSVTNGTVFLPQGAKVVSTTISADSIVVTLDIGSATEVRIYDRKTMQQTGRLNFATEQH
jgi:hypothetical protein